MFNFVISLHSIVIVLIFILLIALFIYWQNNGIRLTTYKYESNVLPKDFDGFKIIQVSDYHNYKPLEKKIVKYAQHEQPDIIVITGDLFDSRKTDIRCGLSLSEKLCKICSVYFVSGNHESRIPEIEKVFSTMEAMGVEIIDDKKQIISRKDGFITLIGAKDPGFSAGEHLTKREKQAYGNKIIKMCSGDNTFKILLAHRPEFIHSYRDAGINLVLCGHAHGGQFSIPFTDIGVFVPSQGLFPPYAAGMKTAGDTSVIISRGIGNSVFPIRLFNRPQVIKAELIRHTKEKN